MSEEKLMSNENEDTVPFEKPYGGITDGEWVCTRCNEPRVGCALCQGMKVSVRPVIRTPYGDRT